MTDDALIGGVGRYYSEKVAEHGATPRGVDWNSAEGPANSVASIASSGCSTRVSPTPP